MGVDIEVGPDGRAALGSVTLSPRPFETLGPDLPVARARFYTIGHSRIKLWHPQELFQLPAVDVGRCDTRDDLERALRDAWSSHIAALREARAWLRALGAPTQIEARGTRLLLPLTGEGTAPAQVISTREVLLPSAGPLASISPGSPADRRYRPLRSLDHPSELELGVAGAMARAAERAATRPATPATPAGTRTGTGTAGPARPASRPTLWQPAGGGAGGEADKRSPCRILALDDEPVILATIQTALASSGFEVDTFTDVQRALGAFQAKSYDLVLADAHMPRADGLEFTARLLDLAGIEQLPVVILDDRASTETREAAQTAGASAYLVKPGTWAEVGDTLRDLLDHVRSRRFVRYPLRLPVRVRAAGREISELTHTVGRAGISLHTRRDISPGSIERYRIELPAPLPHIEADGAVVSVIPQPGSASALAGVRFLRILAAAESHWIRLIEELAKRTANAQRRR